MERYELTEEGKKYLKNGLPELNLIKLLERGPLSIDEAKKQVENFNIALMWAKKNGWVEIEKRKINLVKKPKSVLEQDALERVMHGKAVNEKILSLLVNRKLVSEIREDTRRRAEKIVKKFAGKEVADLTPELIKTGLWKNVKLRKYNVSAIGKRIYLGKRQPYMMFLSEIKKKLITLGFNEVIGPMVETEFWNFDALFQPQNHPARDWADTYQLKFPKEGRLPEIAKNVAVSHEKGWKYKWNPEIAKRLMPRAHGTCVSARTLPKAEIPGKYFCIARCFRPDILDATHLIEFNQIEGIVLDENLTFRNLLGILELFAREIAGADEVKFLPDYYPFTEASVQLSAKHKKLGWVEFGGAGVFREELTKPLGIDIPVIAWGLGIDRLAMFKFGINDIRHLFATDLNWLRNVKVI